MAIPTKTWDVENERRVGIAIGIARDAGFAETRPEIVFETIKNMAEINRLMR